MDEGGLEDFDSVLAFVECRDGIDIQIHAETVAELIGDNFGIDARLSGEGGMSATHNLKRGPFESGRLQSRCDEPPPRVVPADRPGRPRGREDPGIGFS